MKKQWIALLLALGMLLPSAAAAHAAETETAPSAAQIDAGIVAADYEEVGSDLEPSSPLPSSYSSLDLGYVTPVRSQKYNTCWAYSSTAVMEVLLNQLGSGIGHLSPIEMNFRTVMQEDGTGWQRAYYDSGYPYIALGCLTSFGAFTESDVPDSISVEEYAQMRSSLAPYAYADAVFYINGNDIDTVKTAVYQYGAAVANFHFDLDMLNDSTSAYYCDVEQIATSKLYGHAVAIVGWDDDFEPEQFREDHRPQNKGAWLCKNSWGDHWASMGGFFWISYEDKHIFDSRFGPSYAITGVTLHSETRRLKQNETYGATYEFDYPEKLDSTVHSMTYANVVDFTDGFNVIDKVTFESTAEGAVYDVFYIPTDSEGIPSADENEWTLLYTDVIPFEGYICADLEDYAAPVGKGAIGIRISRTDDADSVSIGVDEWLSAGSKSIFIPDAGRNRSYLLGYLPEAYDLMDFYHDLLEDDIGGTFVIKVQSYTDRILGDSDGDGGVTILDATAIQRYLVNLDAFNDAQLLAADYDRDGKVTILDATRIQRMLAGLID